jgi:anti-sigma B factor antagonist
MSDADRPMFDLTTRGAVAVVALRDEKIVTEEAIERLGRQLNALVEEGDGKDLLLDFGRVDFLSSAALSSLIRLKKKTAAVGGRLRLCAIEPDLLEVFRITRLDTVFEIHKDAESALARP